jgi:hypothetical protein
MRAITLGMFAFSILIFAGCNHGVPKTDSTGVPAQTEVKSVKPDSSIIRAKDVDVASLDKNKDGKVFQCAMDANVISDTPGTCPICHMELSEVSIATAKENLK